MRKGEASGARRRRARLRAENPAGYRQQLEAQAQQQHTLQQLSLRYVRPKWHWTAQETALLTRMYPAAIHEPDWQRLFRIIGRSYIAIRRKIAELRRGKRSRSA